MSFLEGRKVEKHFWHIVYTRPRWEKKIAGLLTEKGIENYCPLHKVKRQWSDRTKSVDEPLFQCYLFVKVEEGKKREVTQTNGVLSYVHFNGKPAIISEADLLSIKTFLKRHTFVKLEGSLQLLRGNRGPDPASGGAEVSTGKERTELHVSRLGIVLKAEADRPN